MATLAQIESARQTVVIGNEDPAILIRLVDSYKAEFKPRTPAEEDLNAELALCRWRLRRVWDLETALLDLEILKSPGSPTQQPPEQFRVAAAWKSLADEARSLVLLDRYETRIRNSYSRALRDLQLLRSGKLNPPNEPEPVTEVKPKFEPILVMPHPSATPEPVISAEPPSPADLLPPQPIRSSPDAAGSA